MSLKLNERYPGRFNNPSADYPGGSFKNRTTPDAKDGSYLEKDWANDKEGFFQSLLSAAGITASGTVDKVGASQFFDALQQLKQNQSGVAFATTGPSAALVLTPTPAITAYAAGQRFRVKFNQASTGTDTINVSGRGPLSLKQYDATGAKVAAVFAIGQLSDVEYDGTDWVVLNPLATDLTNATRIDVASAATVNLTSSAPGTRNIRITGTTAITAFTLAIGQTYFVSFAGICTLTNNAAIVTNSGGNIVTAAGDSCIIRATAANVVEVLCYTPGIPQSLGYRQTLQTPARALNTNYTNTSGRPVFMTVRTQTDGGSASANKIGIQLGGGLQYFGAGTPGAGAGYPLSAVGVIPPGAVYRVNINNAALLEWTELTL